VTFSLFPKLKSLLKGTHLQAVEDIHKRMAELLRALSQKYFRRCFKTRKAYMGWCVASNGNYFEGVNM
jgi:hypothetical protein